MSISKQERLNRVVARGEFSDHCHVITGPATITKEGDDTFITVEEDAEAEVLLRHLLESAWMRGEEVPVYVKEDRKDGHVDIKIAPGKYKYVPQVEKDPFEDVIRQVMD